MPVDLDVQERLTETLLTVFRSREVAYRGALAASGRLAEFGILRRDLSCLPPDRPISEQEWEVLKYFLQQVPATTRVVEVGCGWGQLLGLLAAAGYRCTGIDRDSDRLKGASFLRDLVAADFPGAGQRLQYVHAAFPDGWDSVLGHTLEEGPTMGLFRDLGVAGREDYAERCAEQLRRFDSVVMDVVRFARSRISRHAQVDFIWKMRRKGVKFTADVAVGEVTRFVRFAVDESATSASPALAAESAGQTVLDLATAAASPMRSTLSVIDEGPRGRVVRITEDDTTRRSHGMMIVCGRLYDGLYELTVAMRPGGRSVAHIFLLRSWSEPLDIAVDTAAGSCNAISDIAGTTFRIDRLKVAKCGEWTEVTVEVEIQGEPSSATLSIDLADDLGKLYYDGDGQSSVDIGELRLVRKS